MAAINKKTPDEIIGRFQVNSEWLNKNQRIPGL